MRKALGEFFTPQWIAERVLARAYSLREVEGTARVMDPSCGSGTFLVVAIRHALVLGLSTGLTEAEATIGAVESVIGFDINPVAVLMAKVNLLLALGDRVELLPSISFRVYQTDSILIPGVVREQLQLGQAEELRLPLVVGDVNIPAPLATLQGLRALRENIEHAVASARSVALFQTRLRPNLIAIGLEGESLASALAGSVTIYEKISDLARDRKNGIWARVIEQAFAPTIVESVDLLVGNPPWINWKHLPEAWQQRSRSTWATWGLWQRRRGGGGIPLADISALMLARSVATYCRPGGIVALLLPQSVLLADPGGRRIRRCRLGADSAPASEVINFRPIAVDEFSALHPFSPDAANLPVAFYARTAEEHRFPIPQTRWLRAQPKTRLLPHTSWASTMGALRSIDEGIAPIDDHDVSSPWAPLANATDLVLRNPGQPSLYLWGQGFHTRGADGLLFVEVTTPRPVGRDHLVGIRSVPSAGPNTKDDAVREAEVEAEYLWPLLRGHNVNAFNVTPSGLYVIVAHDPDNLTSVLTVDELAQRAPRLFDYLEPWIHRLAGRSPYGELHPTRERPWGIQGPWGHLNRSANLAVTRYMHPQRRPPAAVISPKFDERLGMVTTAYPNNKTNFVAVGSADHGAEAWYLVSFVNAPVAQDSIARFVSSTTIPPSALQRLPILRYSTDNALQGDLVAKGRAVAAGEASIQDLDAAVRALVEN